VLQEGGQDGGGGRRAGEGDNLVWFAVKRGREGGREGGMSVLVFSFFELMWFAVR